MSTLANAEVKVKFTTNLQVRILHVAEGLWTLEGEEGVHLGTWQKTSVITMVARQPMYQSTVWFEYVRYVHKMLLWLHALPLPLGDDKPLIQQSHVGMVCELVNRK